MIEYDTIVEGEVTQQTIEGQSNIYPNEIDPTVPKHVKEITEEDIEKWNQGGLTEITANDVKFEDGTTFQEKYDSGELKGERGEQGIQGVPGTPGKDGINGTNGKDGTNGISATHSWKGTTLTITSASGTSSANLKGEPGQNGTNGKDGKDGVDGKTPVKGVDYFTTADKQELVDLVLAEIPSAEGVGY